MSTFEDLSGGVGRTFLYDIIIRISDENPSYDKIIPDKCDDVVV